MIRKQRLHRQQPWGIKKRQQKHKAFFITFDHGGPPLAATAQSFQGQMYTSQLHLQGKWLKKQEFNSSSMVNQSNAVSVTDHKEDHCGWEIGHVLSFSSLSSVTFYDCIVKCSLVIINVDQKSVLGLNLRPSYGFKYAQCMTSGLYLIPPCHFLSQKLELEQLIS